MSLSLDPRYLPFIRTSDQDVDPNAPRLTFEMKAYMPSHGAELCMTMPYRIQFTYTRPAEEEDSDSRPIVCGWTSWSNLARGRFVLLHETASGELEPVEVGMLDGLAATFYAGEEESCSAYNSAVWEIGPGKTFAPVGHLTANYQTRLVVGETYHLLWPGGVVEMWDWGTKDGHGRTGTLVTSRAVREREDKNKLPVLVMPPAAEIRFKAVETADEPFPDRSKYIRRDGPHTSYDTANQRERQWRLEQQRRRDALTRTSPEPVSPDKRVAGAPVLSLEIIRAGQRKGRKEAETLVKVTYVQGTARSDDRPITIHVWPLRAEGCRFYRWRDTRWDEMEDDSYGAFLIVDAPDVELNIGESNDDNFVSLRPGESWTDETHYSVPGNVAPGDRFKFIFKGATVDWWDWGHKQDQ